MMLLDVQKWLRRWTRNAGFWLLVVIMVFVLAVASYTYIGYRKAATQLVLERDEQLVVLSAARLREELGNLAENLELLARSRDLSSGDIERQLQAIEEAGPSLAVFDGGVVFLDERGIIQIIHPEQTELIGVDWSDRALFDGVFNEDLLFISDIQRKGTEDSQVVMLGVPVQGEEGQFAGALVGMFELGEDTLSAFYASIVRLRLGQSGTTYIVDGTGQILFDSESGRIGRNLTLQQLSRFGAEGEAKAMLTTDERGNQIVAANAPVPGTSWQLIIEDDWAILTRSTRRFSNILLLSFGVALVLPPLSLAILSRQRRFKLLADVLPTSEDYIVRLLRRELHPQQLPVLPGWDLFFKHDSGKNGGHDFFDTMIVPNGRLMMLIGRVDSGGVNGALALTTTRSTLRYSGLQMIGPGEALDQCNKLLCAERPKAYAVQGLYLLLDPSSGSLVYANAGQPPFFIVGADVRTEHQVSSSPMGTSINAEYGEAEVRLQVGEALVILSPSIVNAKNFHGERFGEQAVDILKREHMGTEAMAENLFMEYERFVDRGAEEDKDLSVLILRRVEYGAGE
jgi:hypothetical protein